MKKIWKRNVLPLLLSLLFFQTTGLWASSDGAVIPELNSPVVDKADIFSSSEKQQMVQALLELEKRTSAQLALLTVPDMDGLTIEDFSMRAAEKWRLGQKDRDNGVLIVLAMEEKKVRIEVGYGLEGSLTDAKSGYIIRNVMLPYFRKGNFAQGLYRGTEAVAGIITGSSDISPQELARYQKKAGHSSSGGGGFTFFVVLLFMIFMNLGRMAGGRRRGGLLTGLFLGSLMSRGGRYSSRGFGGFSSGGFGSGGFGGGFSGGGGGFGGGGASGGW